jgi:hypothetical protein
MGGAGEDEEQGGKKGCDAHDVPFTFTFRHV